MGMAAVLVRDGVAHVRGLPALISVVGLDVDLRLLGLALTEDWYACDADVWRARVPGGSVSGVVSRISGPSPYEPVQVMSTYRDGDVLEVVLDTADGEIQVACRPGEEPRVIGLHGTLTITYGDEPLALPVIDPVRVRPLDELLAAATSRPVRPRPASAGHRVPTIEVFPPDEPGERWNVSSEDLAEALGVEAGYEAESLVLRELSRRAPHLVPLVEADSYDTIVSAYTAAEDTARELAAFLRSLTDDPVT